MKHKPKFCLGTAQFGMPYGIANKRGQVDPDEMIAILDLAWENGINTLDTAKSYGNCEESIGNYLKKRSGCLWTIITKLNVSGVNFSDQINDSYEKLTIVPTIIMAHSADIFLEDEFQKELYDLKGRKMIAKVGVSLYNTDEINQVLESALNPDIIQLPMNILDTRLYRNGMLERLYKKNIEIHTRSAFLQGLFYLSEPELKSQFSDIIPHLDKLKSVAIEAGLTLAELSLLWLVRLEEVSKVIIGVNSVAQLKDHFQTLTKDVNETVFEEALSYHYEDETLLNPLLWQSKS